MNQWFLPDPNGFNGAYIYPGGDVTWDFGWGDVTFAPAILAVRRGLVTPKQLLGGERRRGRHDRQQRLLPGRQRRQALHDPADLA